MTVLRTFKINPALWLQAQTVAASRGESASEFLRAAVRQRVRECLPATLAMLDAPDLGEPEATFTVEE